MSESASVLPLKQLQERWAVNVSIREEMWLRDFIKTRPLASADYESYLKLSLANMADNHRNNFDASFFAAISWVSVYSNIVYGANVPEKV